MSIQREQRQHAVLSWAADCAGPGSVGCLTVPPGPLLSPDGLVGFLRSPWFVPYLRETLGQVGRLGLEHYQLRLWPRGTPLPDKDLASKPCWGAAIKTLLEAVRPEVTSAGFYVVVIGCSEGAGSPYLLRRVCSSPASVEALQDLDSPIDYTDGNGKRVTAPGLTQRGLLLSEGRHTRCLLDAQARPMFIVVLKRFVRGQDELTDEELHELWLTALNAVAKAMGGEFIDIRINSGNFQNVSHLHLKVRLPPKQFLQLYSEHPAYQALVSANQTANCKKPSIDNSTNDNG